MKKPILYLVLTFIILTKASSQSCLPDGITFSTQQEIDSFQINYPNCKQILGDVVIVGVDINNLLGLNILESIGGQLTIGGYYWCNPQLSSIRGLDSITIIGGGLSIIENTALKDLKGFSSLQEIGGSLFLTANHSLECIASLNSLTSVENDIRIQSNYALTYLNGLNNLSSVEGIFEFYQNSNLVDLSGIENLTHVGNLSLNHNYNLENINALENLISINGYLFIAYNHGLNNLIGLENTTSIGGPLHIKFNNGLTSLEGIDNIDSWSIDYLYIINNPLLNTCEVQSVCDFLASPHGNYGIHDNASGCNSIEEVEEACITIGHQELNIESDFSIFPIPTNRIINISSKNRIGIYEVNIYNSIGRKVLTQAKITNKIDVSKLVQGLYIIEIITENSKIREKLIIK